MGKSGNHEIGDNERLFEEKKTNLKYKKINRVYNLYVRDYKRKSYLNTHTDPIFYTSPRSGDARLITISILHLILTPQQT